MGIKGIDNAVDHRIYNVVNFRHRCFVGGLDSEIVQTPLDFPFAKFESLGDRLGRRGGVFFAGNRLPRWAHLGVGRLCFRGHG